ncbi:MAG TPA: cytoplasmic protein [Candidatus Marinimicrobia bacterium]|nr:cytoplasmic protein [Candidatus Neomarinimicrobiota bacterium]
MSKQDMNVKIPATAGNEYALMRDIRKLIEETRSTVAIAVNAAMTMLYWNIGRRINTDILQGKRADYGKEIVSTLSRQLIQEYGNSFSDKNLRHMLRFAEAFPDDKIVYALSRQLSWTHFRTVIYLDDPLKRDFYAEMCRLENWSTRTLQTKIDSMLYERTALSKKPDDLIKHELQQLRDKDHLTPELVFKDPYFLDFLGLNDRYLERDLEDAILRELEQFLLELGYGFAFMARQKRIQIDNDDYYIDLLFYHRSLKRLIAIDLKLGDFKAGYKGQMELYLRWLNKHERKPMENEPLGIILCAGKKQEMIELLELGKSGIHVAEYLTELPPRELLRQKLHKALISAKTRIAALPDRTDNKVDDD